MLAKLFETSHKPQWQDLKTHRELLGDGLSYKNQSGEQLMRFFTTKITKNAATFDRLIEMVLELDTAIPTGEQITQILAQSEQGQRPLFDFDCSLVFTDRERILVEE